MKKLLFFFVLPLAFSSVFSQQALGEHHLNLGNREGFRAVDAINNTLFVGGQRRTTNRYDALVATYDLNLGPPVVQAVPDSGRQNEYVADVATGASGYWLAIRVYEDISYVRIRSYNQRHQFMREIVVQDSLYKLVVDQVVAVDDSLVLVGYAQRPELSPTYGLVIVADTGLTGYRSFRFTDSVRDVVFTAVDVFGDSLYVGGWKTGVSSSGKQATVTNYRLHVLDTVWSVSGGLRAEKVTDLVYDAGEVVVATEVDNTRNNKDAGIMIMAGDSVLRDSIYGYRDANNTIKNNHISRIEVRSGEIVFVGYYYLPPYNTSRAWCGVIDRQNLAVLCDTVLTKNQRQDHKFFDLVLVGDTMFAVGESYSSRGEDGWIMKMFMCGSLPIGTAVDFWNQDCDIAVYPNPVTDRLYIKACADLTSWSLFDLQSRLLLSGEVQTNGFVDLSNFTAGMYVLRLESEKKRITKKIIKK